MKRYLPHVIFYIMSVVCLALFITGGALLTAGRKSAHKHVGGHISATQPTCTAAGNTEFWHCETCGKYFSDELLTDEISQADTILAQLPHTEETIHGIPATCTTAGLTDGKRCTVCKTVTLEQTVIKPVPHTEEIIPAVPSSCTEHGMTEGKRCKVCKTVTVKQTTAPLIPHSEEVIQGTPATCTAAGLTDGKHCTVCKNITQEQTEIKVLGHAPDFVPETQSTCFVHGNPDYWYCTRCKQNFAEENCSTPLSQEDVTYPLGDHTYKQCFNTASHYKKATCGHDLGQIDSCEHNFVDSTCTDCGFCNCGVIYSLNDEGTAYSVTDRSESGYSDAVEICGEYDGLPVTEIASFAFSGDSMTSVKIPVNVKVISERAFSECKNLEEITVDEANPAYSGKGNCLIDKKTRTLVTGCKNSVIPDDSSVLSIGNYAFYCIENLTAISIPYAVTRIGNYAFTDCNNLSEIIIPERVTSVGRYAFLSCENLARVTIPASLTSIEEGAFSRCKSLQEISLPYGVKSIDVGAFRYCTSLKSLNIPASITEIGNTAFIECTRLEEITVDKENPYFRSDGNCIINSSNQLILGCKNSVIPDGVNTIARYAFYKCPITAISLPESLNYIDLSAFYGCDKLTKLHIPENVRMIDDFALLHMSALTEITVDDRNHNYCAAGNCLIDKRTKTIMVGCTNSVIPDDGSVTNIYEYAFRHTGVEKIVIPACITLTELPSFLNCVNLKEIVILANIEKIPKYVFSGCTNLTNVVLPEGLKEIGDYAFENCMSLTEIIIPDSVTKIRLYPFMNCSTLSKVKFPDSLTSLLIVRPFTGCENVTEFDTGDGLKDLDALYLRDLKKLKTLILGESITEIKLATFYNLTELTTVTIKNSETIIKHRAFLFCTSLTDIYYNGTKEQWLAVTEDDWDYNTGDYTIHFNDGTTMKKGETA